MKLLKVLLCAVTLLFLISAASADAATIHVNETGWWFEGGSFNASSTPIQSAVNAASDGDLILIEPGNYSIDSTIDVNKGVDIMGNGSRDEVLIEANNVNVFHFHDKLFPNVEVRNLTIISSGSWKKGIFAENFEFLWIENVNVSSYQGVYAENSSLRVEDSEISASRGVEAHQNSYVEVENCSIVAGTGVWIVQSSGVVQNSYIKGGYCIEVSDSSSVSILNNEIIVKAGYEGPRGIYLHDSSGVTVGNNEMEGLGDYTTGIYIFSSSGFTIYNNTVRDLKTGIYIHYSSNGLFEDNNLTGNIYNLRFFGSAVEHYVHAFTGNYINGKPVYYYVNAKNVVVPSNAGFIGIVNSKNVYANGFNISKNWHGVLIINSSDVYVKGKVYNCKYGVVVKWSENVTFSGEVFKDSNKYAGSPHVYVEESSASVVDAVISKTFSRYEGDCGINAKSSSITVKNVTISSKFPTSVWLRYSENCLIEDSTIENVVHLYDTSNSIIRNCSISVSGWDNGIRMYDSSHNTIENNTISAYNGIYCIGSHYNTIRSNVIENCNNEGIRLVNSDYNEILNNTVEDCKYGIRISEEGNGYGGIYESENNTLEDNIVRNNDFGIGIDYSEYTRMRNNVMENNEYNFGVKGSKLSHFVHDIDTSNTVNGKPVYYLVGQSDAVIDSTSNAGYVGIVDSKNIQIKDLSIGNNRQCMLVAYSRDCSIENVMAFSFSIAGIDVESSENISVDCEAYNAGEFSWSAGIRLYNSTHCYVSCYSHDNTYGSACGAYLEESDYNEIAGEYINNGYGLYLTHSDSNFIQGNFSDNNRGIYLMHSNGNIISNSDVIHNYYNGIYGGYSSYNEIRDCNISLTYHYYGDGIYIYNSHDSLIDNCTLIGNADCGVELSADNNRIANCTIAFNKQGIRINSGAGNHIEMNEIANNTYKGVEIKSQHNTIAFNNITGNDYGIYLTNSYNSIYLNNFMGNDQQAYSSGVNTWKSFNASYEYNGNTYTGYLGNYWSDYAGSDADGDGIGDTAYEIDDNDADHYPLVATKESYENVTPLPPPTYNVEGWIIYEGWDYGGKIYVFAKNSTTDEIVNYTDIASWSSYPKFYSFKLPNGSYYIEAYMDLNNNNLLDEDEKEPWGYAINKNPYAGQSPNVITVSGAEIVNVNITLMRPSPEITDYYPENDVVENNAGESRQFRVSADETVNVTWLINGTAVETDSKVESSTYTNESAEAGVWAVKAVIENAFGSDEHEWTWKVRAIISCDADGNPKDAFAPGECVYVKGENLEPNTDYKIWIQPEPVSDGETLSESDDPSGSQEIVVTNANGEFGPTAIWCIPEDAQATYQEWDIVADKGGNGIYNPDTDAIDSVKTYGFVAPIPEFATLLLVSAGFAVLILRRKI